LADVSDIAVPAKSITFPADEKAGQARSRRAWKSPEVSAPSAKGPVPCPGHDEKRPLDAGMVISIETTVHHPKRGFIKLEHTVVVTENSWEGLGDTGRGWNPMGVG
jgi:hypothetical protein